MTALYANATDAEERAIRQVVALSMDAPFAAKSGHSGTAMALAPLGVALFSRVMRHHPLHPEWPDRDRFILSNGHACILQYSLALTFGYEIGIEDIRQFREAHSRTPGHPEAGCVPTVEVTTGPLGQGVGNGVGMALAERILRAQHGEDLVDHRTWVIAGDGCFEEGVSHEAASFAGFQGLDRLTIFYDDNHITIDGPTELALADNPAERFRGYGWHVVELGEAVNDLDAVEDACRQAIAEKSRPTLVVVRSHIGFPSPTMEDTKEAHGNPFSAEAISAVREILGLPDEPFPHDEDLPELLREDGRVNDLFASWEARLHASGARGHALLDQIAHDGVNVNAPAPKAFSGEPVPIRKAMTNALAAASQDAPGLVSGSADLTENTNVLLEDVDVQSVQHPGGRQLHYGIREFAMGTTMVGLAHHGGLRPLGSTFFCFSDYQRPSVRLAALSEARVLFVYTHDSIGLGQDGPTHQPIEHLMSLRAMPRLHVVRPSDANEAARLAHALLTDPHMPTTALVLTRQAVPLLEGDDAKASEAGAARGGYVVREHGEAEITLVATGSEVPLVLHTADALAAHGVIARVVALPCWRCFDEQPAAYRDEVLCRSLPSISVEAGATLGWERYVDEAIGLDSFGMSAPGEEVFTYFNFTVEALTHHVQSRVGRRD